MALDAEKEFAEERRKCKGNERDCDGSDAGPDDEGVPLPMPELTCECDGVCARRFEQGFGRERYRLGVEDEAAETHERNYEQEL